MDSKNTKTTGNKKITSTTELADLELNDDLASKAF